MSNTNPALLPDQAILIATEEEKEEVSPWYTDGTYTFRFKRVPQFLFATGLSHLRSRLRRLKPKPPIIRKSGREMTNKADPYYIADLEIWKQEQEDLSQEANISTAIFRGIEVKGGVPPIEDWIDGVLEDFWSIGISEEDAYHTFYHDKNRLHQLWFKKFVILKTKAVTEKFSEFQGQELDDDNLEDDEDAAFASDMFQPDTSRNAS